MKNKPSDLFRALCEVQDLEQKMLWTVARIADLEPSKPNKSAQEIHDIMIIEHNLHKYTQKLYEYVAEKIQESLEPTKETSD